MHQVSKHAKNVTKNTKGIKEVPKSIVARDIDRERNWRVNEELEDLIGVIELSELRRLIASEWRVLVNRVELAEIKLLEDAIRVRYDLRIPRFFRSEPEQQHYLFILILPFGVSFD